MNRALILIFALFKVCYTILATTPNADILPEITISNVSYNYHPSASFDGTPCFSGTLSFTMNLNDMPDYIIIGKTKPHLNDNDMKFMTVKYPITNLDFSGKLSYQLEDIDWGTYINATWRKNDGRYVISNMICSTDYLSEADKALIAPYLASMEVVHENDLLEINGREMILTRNQRGLVSAYSSDGKHIITTEIFEGVPFVFPDYPPNRIIILQITLHNRTIIKKLYLQ